MTAMATSYSLADIVQRNALSSTGGERVALTNEGASFTYRQLNDRSLRLANALLGLGVRKGDSVAVLMGNSHEWPEALFAISSIGAVCVPVNVLLNAREVEHVVRDSGAVAVIADKVAQRALGDLSTLPDRLIRVGDFEAPAGGTWHGYEDLLARAAARVPDYRPDSSDKVMMYYTSGTTGLPKGAVHSQAGVLWNTYHQIGDVGLSRDNVYLLIPSLSWAAGFHDIMLALMWLGGRIAMVPTGGLTIDRVVTAIEKEGVTHVLLVPTLLKMLVATPGAFERLRRTRLKRIFTGGEFVPSSVIETVNSELPGCRVIPIYGMSEFPLMMTILDADDSLRHPERTGKASSIVTLAVCGADGVIVDRGEGEVVIRSPANMLGYHNRPDATAEAQAGGWFRTGDTGVLDDQGFLTLTGRAKDMIISGGMNIYAREIEDVVHRVAGVRDVAVVGVPDPKWGEIPVAIVVVEDGARPDATIQSACEQQLSSYKRPRITLLREEPLPRTPTGKVLKRLLRPWAEEQIRARQDSVKS